LRQQLSEGGGLHGHRLVERPLLRHARPSLPLARQIHGLILPCPLAGRPACAPALPVAACSTLALAGSHRTTGLTAAAPRPRALPLSLSLPLACPLPLTRALAVALSLALPGSLPRALPLPRACALALPLRRTLLTTLLP